MRTPRTSRVCCGLVAALVIGCATTGVRTIDRAPGYGLSAVDVRPRAGTSLVAGQPVALKITVDYELEVADSGSVVLIPQDEKGTSLVVGRGQVTEPVKRGSGRVIISDTLVVPPGIRYLQLFVLLVPAGYTEASGQLVINFPVRASN